MAGAMKVGTAFIELQARGDKLFSQIQTTASRVGAASGAALSRGVQTGMRGMNAASAAALGGMTRLGSGMVGVGNRMQAVGRAGQQMGQRFTTWAQPIDRAGQSMKTMSVVSAGAFAGVIKSSSDFQYAMTRVKAISGATGTEFQMLNSKAKELGSSTQFSATQAADAMGYLAMAGFKPMEVYQALPAVLNGAAAAGMDLARTSDIVSNIMTGYGLAATDASRATDLLISASTKGNVNVEMLGESFKYGSSMAKIAGLSIEEAAASYTLLGNAGLQGSMGGTAMQAMLRSLMKPARGVKDIMEKTGLSFQDASGKMKPLPQILDEVGKANLTNEQKIRLFGAEGIRAYDALSSQGTDKLRSLTKELENSQGTTDKFAETMSGTAKAGMQGFKSAIEGLAIAIGESGLLDAFTKAINKVSEFIRGLANAPKPVHQLMAVFLAVGGVLSPALLLFSKLGLVVRVLFGPLISVGRAVTTVGTGMVGASRGIALFVAGFKSVRTATSGLSAMALMGGKLKNFFQIIRAGSSVATLAGPALRIFALGIRAIGLAIMSNPIVAAIVAVIAGLVLLYTKCEWFRDAVNAVWEAIKTAALAVWDWIRANVWPVVVAIWQGIVTYFKFYIGVVLAVYNTVKDGAVAVWSWIRDNVLPVVKSIWDGIVAAFKFGVDLVTVIVAVVKGVVLGVWDVLAAIVVPIVQGLWAVIVAAFNVGKVAVEAVMAAVRWVIEMAWAGIKAVWDLVVTWLWPPLQAAFELVRAGVEAAMNAVSAVISAVWSVIKAVWSAAVAFLGPPVTAAFNAVRSVVSSVMRAVASVISTVWGAIKAAWSAAVNFLRPIVVTVFNAVRSVVTSVMNTLRSIVSAVWSAIKSAFNTGVSIVKGAINGFVAAIRLGASKPQELTNKVREMVGRVVEFMRSLPGKVVSAVGNLGRTLWNAGKDLIQGLINGAKSIAGNIVGAIKGAIPGPIRKFLPFSVSLDPSLDTGGWLPDPFAPVAVGYAAGGAGAGGPMGYASPTMAQTFANVASDLKGIGAATSKMPDFDMDGFSAEVGKKAGGSVGIPTVPQITVNAQTNADPLEIGREIAWQIRTSGR